MHQYTKYMFPFKDIFGKRADLQMLNS